MKIILSLVLASFLFSQNEVCLEIEGNPNLGQQAFSGFTKYINVLDCFDVFAENSIPDSKVLHAAAVAAQLLDNNEDGIVDDDLLREELASRQALIPIFSSEWSLAANNFFDYYNGDGASAVLFNNEIDPTQTGHWGDDATVEEVVHVINHIGHVSIYPEVFNIEPNSSIMSDAMDIARGGQFLNVPNIYPEEAWYHYDDWTCDYGCMAIEYLYWCIVSHMGILDDSSTCFYIYNEWELCTPELFADIDVTMYNILTNPDYKIPQYAPDGNYCPFNGTLGDINNDLTIDILDVVLAVNIVLGVSENNVAAADMNTDGIINILDIIIIINQILI